MLRPALVSVGLHVMVVMAFTISWPSFDKDDDLQTQLVVIDMVNLTEVTNIADASEGSPKDERWTSKKHVQSRRHHHRRHRHHRRRQNLLLSQLASLHLRQSLWSRQLRFCQISKSQR